MAHFFDAIATLNISCVGVCIKGPNLSFQLCMRVTRIGFRKPIPWMIELGETEFNLSKNFPFRSKTFFSYHPTYVSARIFAKKR